MDKQCIIKNIISEKTSLANKNNCYCFMVKDNANKIEVQKAIEERFTVKVKKINMSLYLTKAKKKYTQNNVNSTKVHGYKKAYVYLDKNSNLNFDNLV